MAIGNKNNKTHTIDFRMAKYLFWMQKKMIKNMKACLLDKVLFKQEESLSVTAEVAHVGRSTRVTPTSLLWEGVGSHTQQKKPWAEKQSGGISHQHPLSPGPHKWQKLKPQEIKRVLFFPPQYYFTIKLFTRFENGLCGLYPPLHLSAFWQRWEATTAFYA